MENVCENILSLLIRHGIYLRIQNLQEIEPLSELCFNYESMAVDSGGFNEEKNNCHQLDKKCAIFGLKSLKYFEPMGRMFYVTLVC